MERRLGKLGTAAFSAALILEGCSSFGNTPSNSKSQESESPTPTAGMVDFLLNCQTNHLDEKAKFYALKRGETVRVGAITESGQENVFIFGAEKDGDFSFTPEQAFNGLGSPHTGGIELKDDNFLIRAAGKIDGNITTIGVHLTCIDAVPQIPSPTAPQFQQG